MSIWNIGSSFYAYKSGGGLVRTTKALTPHTSKLSFGGDWSQIQWLGIFVYNFSICLCVYNFSICLLFINFLILIIFHSDPIEKKKNFFKTSHCALFMSILYFIFYSFYFYFIFILFYFYFILFLARQNV